MKREGMRGEFANSQASRQARVVGNSHDARELRHLLHLRWNRSGDVVRPRPKLLQLAKIGNVGGNGAFEAIVTNRERLQRGNRIELVGDGALWEAVARDVELHYDTYKKGEYGNCGRQGVHVRSPSTPSSAMGHLGYHRPSSNPHRPSKCFRAWRHSRSRRREGRRRCSRNPPSSAKAARR